MVGGCCGTTPEHIRVVVDKLEGKRDNPTARPQEEPEDTVSSLYTAVPLTQDTGITMIGERTHVPTIWGIAARKISSSVAA